MEEQASPARIALKYGLLTSLAIIIFTTIVNVTGLFLNKGLSSLSYVILIVGIVLAMKDFRVANKGYMSYGQGLGLGSMLSAIIGLLGSMFMMFYNQFIDSTIVQQVMDAARQDMESRGMDDAQIDQAMAFTEKLTSPGIQFFIGVLGFLVTGFIFSLIIAAIMRKEKPVFE